MIKSSSLLFFFPFFWLRKNVCIRLTQSYTTHGYITHRSFRLLSLSHINQSEHKNPILSKEKKKSHRKRILFCRVFFLAWDLKWNHSAQPCVCIHRNLTRFNVTTHSHAHKVLKTFYFLEILFWYKWCCEPPSENICKKTNRNNGGLCLRHGFFNIWDGGGGLFIFPFNFITVYFFPLYTLFLTYLLTNFSFFPGIENGCRATQLWCSPDFKQR
jgi:hypothetical protein